MFALTRYSSRLQLVSLCLAGTRQEVISGTKDLREARLPGNKWSFSSLNNAK